jgi:serine/threonine protein kinase
MIADLMSAAELGPKIMKRNGFDFVLFSDCLEFDMEMCSETKIKTLEEDLKANLFKMHLIKVVHSDIKPANVMFSECYKKNVFLDFGVGSVLSQ